jgi:hypothetical protein
MAGFKVHSNTARPAKGSFIVQSKNESQILAKNNTPGSKFKKIKNQSELF